ncbi:SDR family oxidoreductase [Roseobacter sp. YSTF-M11]|uniref:SDR family oxidoreductase n=1 Tax=Roseobacter insulae TaxID=2859783 RepID=A0A9X1FS17_9RHOB|nr:SDR family oxidoreductase [Roseobacter insulae]MBW4706734.1 SDR family oxidoreductase [Roseobacter insulae]
MEFSGKTVVITGGASGIGAALAAMLVKEKAQVVIADLDAARVDEASHTLGCCGIPCDVTREADVTALVRKVSDTVGPIDIFVSNAGLLTPQPGHAASSSDEDWMRNWSVHVMAHVYAARALLPQMIARRSGYFVNVTSAAGLLNQIGNAAYSATKHAAVSFAESLAISHASDGIGVSVVCPQYVATPLIGLSAGDAESHEGLLSAAQVAERIVSGVEAGEFLILPHPQVAGYAQSRAQDHDGWIRGMVRLRARLGVQSGTPDGTGLYKLV